MINTLVLNKSVQCSAVQCVTPTLLAVEEADFLADVPVLDLVVLPVLLDVPALVLVELQNF